MKNQTIEKTLRKIAAEHGGVLQPEDVVAAAKSPRSPLHKKFTWEDSEAAHQWRLWEARQLIRVCVEVVAHDADPVPVFVSLSTDRGNTGGGYRVTTHVMSDVEMREQLLKDALFELNCFQRKYAKLRQLSDVFSAIRKVKQAA